MTTDPPELGKGVFGYRKSAVNQILADRDIMLRQAEGRVRAAESKVAELESELGSLKGRNSRMDEQLDRLRTQLDALAARTPGASEPVQDETDHDEAVQDETVYDQAIPTDEVVPAWPEEPLVAALAPEPPAEEPFLFGEPDAEFAGLDPIMPSVTDSTEATPGEPFADPVHEVSIFDEAPDDVPGDIHAPYDTAPDEPAPVGSWLDADAPAADTGMGDLIYSQTDYSYDPGAAEPAAPAEPFSFPYDSVQYDDQIDELPPIMTFEDGSGTSYDADAPPASSDPWGLSAGEAGSGTSALAEAAAAAAAAAEVQASVDSQAPQASVERSPEPLVEPAQDHQEAAQAAAGVSAEAIDVTNRFITDEIQGILAAAEESASRIVERARTTTQNQIAQSNRLWREVQAEVSRFAAWREEVEPVIGAVQSKVESVRSHIEEVPERIRQALAPMADSISSIDADLAELAAAATPPLLLTPRGLDDGADHAEEWGADDMTGYADPTDHVERGDGSAAEGDDSSGHMAG